MKTVYVVTDGEYSDYHIVGIFSTEEKADKFAKINGKDNVEKWEIDELDGYINRTVYNVGVKLNDGGVKGTWTTTEMALPNARVPEVSRNTSQDTAYGISFISYEHATKLAIEKRQEYLREQALKEKE